MREQQTKKVKRPQTQQEILMRQYRFAKSSFAIEGVHLSKEVTMTIETCIASGCTTKQLQDKLQAHIDGYVI